MLRSECMIMQGLLRPDKISVENGAKQGDILAFALFSLYFTIVFQLTSEYGAKEIYIKYNTAENFSTSKNFVLKLKCFIITSMSSCVQKIVTPWHIPRSVCIWHYLEKRNCPGVSTKRKGSTLFTLAEDLDATTAVGEQHSSVSWPAIRRILGATTAIFRGISEGPYC